MKWIPFILQSFQLLLSYKPGKLAVIFFLTLVMGLNSGLSIVLLIPLLQLLSGAAGSPTEGLALSIHQFASRVGLSLNIESILIFFALLLGLNALLQYWKSILDAKYQQTFISEIRRRLFRKIILADWPMLNNKSKTNHLQVLTKEVPNLANYLYFYLRLISSILMTASYMAYALLVSVKFCLIITGIGLLLFILLRKFLYKSFSLGEGAVNSYNHLLKYIDDFWETVKIAKVHSSEAYYYRKFDEANTSLLDLEFQMERNYSLPRLIYSFSGIVVLLLVVYVGYRIDHVPMASFFILILLFSRIFPQFVGINTDLSMIIANVPSVKLVMQLDEDFPDAAFHQPVSHYAVQLKREIKIEKLKFAYSEDKQLFKEFSETIPAQKLTGIIGESGSGKTTLIDLIAGLQKPESGQILVDDQPLDDESLPYWKSSIGYLPQDSFFVDGTFRENLVWDSSSDISDLEIMQVLEQVNAAQLVNRFPNKLDEHIVNYPFNFSGGECQRLALARVLLRRPSLLLLDEATSSLDPENEQQIMEVVQELKKKTTIVFVTHRSSLLSYFDKVIKIDGSL